MTPEPDDLENILNNLTDDDFDSINESINSDIDDEFDDDEELSIEEMKDIWGVDFDDDDLDPFDIPGDR
jgi:hypothetical protein